MKEWKRTSYKDNVAVYNTYIGWNEEEKYVSISLTDRTQDESAKIQVRTIQTNGIKIPYNAIMIPVSQWFGESIPKHVIDQISKMGSYNVFVDYRNINTGNVYEITGVVQQSADEATSRGLATMSRREYDKNGYPEWKQIVLTIPTDETALKPTEDGNEPDNIFDKINIRMTKIDNKADRALRSVYAVEHSLSRFQRKNFLQRLKWLFFGD